MFSGRVITFQNSVV